MLTHQFALENPWIRADVIEATEFPQLAARYQVYAVPRLVINEGYFIEGALPEPVIIRHLLSALGLEGAMGETEATAAPTTRVDPSSL